MRVSQLSYYATGQPNERTVCASRLAALRPAYAPSQGSQRLLVERATFLMAMLRLEEVELVDGFCSPPHERHGASLTSPHVPT